MSSKLISTVSSTEAWLAWPPPPAAAEDLANGPTLAACPAVGGTPLVLAWPVASGFDPVIAVVVIEEEGKGPGTTNGPEPPVAAESAAPVEGGRDLAPPPPVT